VEKEIVSRAPYGLHGESSRVVGALLVDLAACPLSDYAAAERLSAEEIANI
jgi:hypothetical protein